MEADLPEPETWAKNLFLRDKKKQHYYLLTLRDEKRADLKAFAAYVGATQVRFASENDLKKYLNLTAGSDPWSRSFGTSKKTCDILERTSFV